MPPGQTLLLPSDTTEFDKSKSDYGCFSGRGLWFDLSLRYRLRVKAVTSPTL